MSSVHSSGHRRTAHFSKRVCHQQISCNSFGRFPSPGMKPRDESPRRRRHAACASCPTKYSSRRVLWLSGSNAARALMVLVPFILLLAGCTQTMDRAVDAKEAETASIGGFGEIRSYLDSRRDEAPSNLAEWKPATTRGHVDALMISGGGAAGAFSVGVLSAWTEARTRPCFDVVTGVSTGALIAPFAFLGSDYDGTLVHLYTSGVARELAESKRPGGLFGPSLLRPDPLRRMVDQFLTPAIMEKIAAEHRKGRRLLVLTTNLDTQRAVVWNMGVIANSQRPASLQLFRDILVASASIPGVYPAVMIEAESAGRYFEEMHSDGGSASQVLVLPQALLTSSERLVAASSASVNFYVIINNALMPEFAKTPDKTLSVVARAYSILVKSQTQNALTALYNYARLTGAHFHVASIDSQVPYSILDPFNTNYMRAVYNLGYAEFQAGNLWKDRPVFR